MTFNSIQFLIFFPVVTVLYFVLPQRFRWMLLLAASYYFYMSWNPSLVFLIAFTTAVSYAAALLMHRTESKKVKKTWLIITLAACLGVLFFYKYFNFLSSSVTGLLRLFRLPVEDHLLDLILPVGISFYTFQTLSYVIDVYRKEVPAQRNVLVGHQFVCASGQMPIRSDSEMPVTKFQCKFIQCQPRFLKLLKIHKDVNPKGNAKDNGRGDHGLQDLDHHKVSAKILRYLTCPLTFFFFVKGQSCHQGDLLFIDHDFLPFLTLPCFRPASPRTRSVCRLP